MMNITNFMCTECFASGFIAMFTGNKRYCKDCMEKLKQAELNKKRDPMEPLDHYSGCTYYRMSYGGSICKECECSPDWFEHKRNCKCECAI